MWVWDLRDLELLQLLLLFHASSFMLHAAENAECECEHIYIEANFVLFVVFIYC